MFIELIDLLRCPVPHEDSWLVAAFTKMDGRFVRQGKLGCPVCSNTYPINDGIAHFAPAGSAGSAVPAARSEEEVVRSAALLGLTRPGALVIIVGSSTAGAAELAEMTDSRVIIVNPPVRIAETEKVGIVTAGERLPLADASADGMIIDDSSSALVSEAARLLKPGGRIVAGPDADLGPRFTELARDERNVVGESRGPLVALSR